MKKLIVLLEGLTNKKVIFEDSVFKSRRMDERLLPAKKKLDEYIELKSANHILIDRNIEFKDCLMLEKFYQGYKVDVDGSVFLCDEYIKKLPIINFNKIIGNFWCDNAELISLKGCPKFVGGDFDCKANLLESLEFCPEVVLGDFKCHSNAIDFTVDDVKKYCKVSGMIKC
jgi:hypothetical protein